MFKVKKIFLMNNNNNILQSDKLFDVQVKQIIVGNIGSSFVINNNTNNLLLPTNYQSAKCSITLITFNNHIILVDCGASYEKQLLINSYYKI